MNNFLRFGVKFFTNCGSEKYVATISMNQRSQGHAFSINHKKLICTIFYFAPYVVLAILFIIMFEKWFLYLL